AGRRWTGGHRPPLACQGQEGARVGAGAEAASRTPIVPVQRNVVQALLPALEQVVEAVLLALAVGLPPASAQDGVEELRVLFRQLHQQPDDGLPGVVPPRLDEV